LVGKKAGVVTVIIYDKSGKEFDRYLVKISW
jgi:hypothetical protein